MTAPHNDQNQLKSTLAQTEPSTHDSTIRVRYDGRSGRLIPVGLNEILKTRQTSMFELAVTTTFFGRAIERQNDFAWNDE
jgi:hypothetical protein